jgi:hypothetical protein
VLYALKRLETYVRSRLCAQPPIKLPPRMPMTTTYATPPRRPRGRDNPHRERVRRLRFRAGRSSDRGHPETTRQCRLGFHLFLPREVSKSVSLPDSCWIRATACRWGEALPAGSTRRSGTR